jgi:hypothetical protein
MAPRRVKRNRRGAYVIDLPDEERDVLLSLGPQLRALLTHGNNDPDLRRLFPAAYPDDPEADAFFRQVTHDDLLSRRLTNLDLMEAALHAETVDEPTLQAVMGAINDIRLVLGTKLDVSEDDDPADFQGDERTESAYAVYHYLGWLLELIVDALSDP